MIFIVKKSRAVRVAITILCSSLLVACSKPTPDTRHQHHEHKQTEVDNGADKVTAVENNKAKTSPRGKPGAQVMLAENEIYQLEANVAGEIKLVLITPYEQGQLELSVTASDGLDIISDVTQFTFSLDTDTDTDYAIPLQLFAKEDGRYYLHLQVSLQTPERTTFRALSAIVLVGADEAQPKAAQKVRKSSEEKPVILLPAEETILFD